MPDNNNNNNSNNNDSTSAASASASTNNKPPTPEEVLNVNVGILGHVDSGKTSLVKTLSTLLSTAALDKSKQSRQRGMTLDLGFSCFFLDLPEHLKEQHPTKTKLQMTLVDCPGHASLIRTIIGGAQIIDMVLLVVDAYKGWQAQTTECLVLAELTSPHLVVALNKVDMFPEHEREEKLAHAKLLVQQRLAKSKFPNATMVGVSACIGGEKVAALRTNAASSSSSSSGKGGDATTTAAESSKHANNNPTHNIDVLIETLQKSLPAPKRNIMTTNSTTTTSEDTNNNNNNNNNNNSNNTPQQQKIPFYFAIDHCFPIKGMGTVLTGTVLSGTAKVNDTVEFPTLGLERKIKSMQMFKRKCFQIQQGDRAGICVSSLDSTLLERGVAATPNAVQLLKGAIVLMRKIPYYFGDTLPDKSKFHISVGHTTVMATVSFWGGRELAMAEVERRRKQQKKKQIQQLTTDTTTEETKNDDHKTTKNNKNKSTKKVVSEIQSSSLGGDADRAGLPYLKFDWNQDFLQQNGYYTPTEMELNGGGVDSDNDTTTTTTTTTNGIDSSTTALNWAILDFQTPVYCPLNSLIIGSRLDANDNNAAGASKGNKDTTGTTTSSGGAATPKKKDTTTTATTTTTSASSCRLAFCGRLIEKVKNPQDDFKRIRLYTPKERRGVVSRLGDPHRRQDDQKIVRYELFGSDLFKKETLLKPFLGMKLVTPQGDVGELKSAFGTSGKFRVYFPAGTEAREGDVLILPFKRFVHDPEKKMRQEDIVLPAARPGSRLDPPDHKKKNQQNNNKNKKPDAVGQVEKVKGDVVVDGGGDGKSQKLNMAIIVGFFTPEINVREKVGAKVIIPSTKEEGQISGAFGKAGKCKVTFANGISMDAAGANAELYYV